MLTLCPQARLLHHKRKKNDQAIISAHRGKCEAW